MFESAGVNGWNSRASGCRHGSHGTLHAPNTKAIASVVPCCRGGGRGEGPWPPLNREVIALSTGVHEHELSAGTGAVSVPRSFDDAVGRLLDICVAGILLIPAAVLVAPVYLAYAW